MKTEQTDLQKKAEMINALSAIINKHCQTSQDTWSFIRAMQASMEHLTDKRLSFRSDLNSDLRSIRNKLSSNNVSVFDDISDAIVEAVMISGSNTEGFIVFNEMNEDLTALSNQSI